MYRILFYFILFYFILFYLKVKATQISKHILECLFKNDKATWLPIMIVIVIALDNPNKYMALSQETESISISDRQEIQLNNWSPVYVRAHTCFTLGKALNKTMQE